MKRYCWLGYAAECQWIQQGQPNQIKVTQKTLERGKITIRSLGYFVLAVYTTCLPPPLPPRPPYHRSRRRIARVPRPDKVP